MSPILIGLGGLLFVGGLIAWAVIEVLEASASRRKAERLRAALASSEAASRMRGADALGAERERADSARDPEALDARIHALDLTRMPEPALPWIPAVLATGCRPGQRAARVRERVEQLLGDALEPLPGDPAEKPALSHQDAGRALPLLVDLALAAGTFDAETERLLQDIGASAQLPAPDVRAIIDQRVREWEGRTQGAATEQPPPPQPRDRPA